MAYLGITGVKYLASTLFTRNGSGFRIQTHSRTSMSLEDEEQGRKIHNNMNLERGQARRQNQQHTSFNSSRVQFLSFPLSLLLLYPSLPSPSTTPSFASHHHHHFGGDNIRIILSLAVSLITTTLFSIPFTILSMLHLLRLV